MKITRIFTAQKALNRAAELTVGDKLYQRTLFELIFAHIKINAYRASLYGVFLRFPDLYAFELPASFTLTGIGYCL